LLGSKKHCMHIDFVHQAHLKIAVMTVVTNSLTIYKTKIYRYLAFRRFLFNVTLVPRISKKVYESGR